MSFHLPVSHEIMEVKAPVHGLRRPGGAFQLGGAPYTSLLQHGCVRDHDFLLLNRDSGQTENTNHHAVDLQRAIFMCCFIMNFKMSQRKQVLFILHLKCIQWFPCSLSHLLFIHQK